MARPSSILIPIGILMLTWSTCSTAAALSLEDRFQQFQEDYIQFKKTVNEKEVTIEAEQKAKDQQNSKFRESLVNKINELEGKVAILESQLHQQDQQTAAISSINAIPIDVNDTKHQSRFINEMPSSCRDLKVIGHTLNGLYSIIGLQAVETVYCNFNKQLDDPDLENWIGYQDLKTRSTYFHVQKTEKFSTVDIPIPFERLLLNKGGAMNLETGIFTAPVTGTYFFSFNGVVQFELTSAGELSEFAVRLYRNNQEVGRSQINEVNAITNINYLMPITLQSTLKLKAADKVWVQVNRGPVYGYLFDYADTYSTNFNGWLLEEEIFDIENVVHAQLDSKY
ncbi:hypothetical protein GHT06_011029 [Daphnia sinensis]|uniref:C1q domain-containing protein n=1 Tax=Daphnia sinensis TaxID=1820382 RepID=A0AAD5Q1R4_9CRUS|nr:hypothetical protein GHT06_011029 [Daphnia sinensis]